MEHEHSLSKRATEAHSLTLRDFLDTAFRHPRLMTGCLAAIVLVPLIAALVLPKYKGEMKFFLVRERVDPVVTPSAAKDNLNVTNIPVVSEEELNSEVELLNNHELLRSVVLASGLADNNGGSRWWGWRRTKDEQVEDAIRDLDHDLEVDPVKKANVISVTYKNKNPRLAARVLSDMSRLYLEKHRDVHRLPGQFKFFEGETEQYRNGLDRIEAQLADFPRKSGVVSPALSRDIILQKLYEFEASGQQTQAAIAETQNRIRELEEQSLITPARITTQLRKADNPQLLQIMKSTLLNLELKHSELIAKYQPDYRPVQELEKEIAQTRAAIAGEEQAPIKDETTDVDPVKEWIRSELSKDNATVQGLEARARATQNAVHLYRMRASELEKKSIEHGDLLRAAKAQENNYLLYLTKREEARITEALDQSRILNVAMAEEPTVPALPAHSPVTYAMVSTLFMVLLSIGLVATLHYVDTTLRSPSEIELLLNTPVLASVPFNHEAHGTNGNGNGNRKKQLSFIE